MSNPGSLRNDILDRSELTVEPLIKALLGDSIAASANLKPAELVLLQKFIYAPAANAENDLQILNSVAAFLRQCLWRIQVNFKCLACVHVCFLPQGASTTSGMCIPRLVFR